jgi:hypothetical protein
MSCMPQRKVSATYCKEASTTLHTILIGVDTTVYREIAAIIKVCIVLCYSSYSFKSNLIVLVP